MERLQKKFGCGQNSKEGGSGGLLMAKTIICLIETPLT